MVSGCGVPAGTAVYASQTCGGTGLIRLADGSEVALQSASLQLRDTTGTLVELSSGTITASVQPQAPGAAWIVRTRHGEARVIGTRFTVALSDDRTAVSVAEGAVNVATDSAQKSLLAGEEAELLATGAIATANSSIDLLAPGMQALSPMLGGWEMVDGVLRGTGDDQKSRCRIRSHAVFAHGELEIEARGDDAFYLEVQVRGYRAVVGVDLRGNNAWQTVRVIFTPDFIRATVNGRDAEVTMVKEDWDNEDFVSVFCQTNPGGHVDIRRWQVIPRG